MASVTLRGARASLLVALLTPGLVGSRCGSRGADSDHLPAVAAGRAFSLDEASARADLAELTASPHPFGSPRQLELSRWLGRRMAPWTMRTESFQAEVPRFAALEPGRPVALTMTVAGANIWALPPGPAPKCVVLIGSHYDTKQLPGQRYLGANDSGSSSALLLQLLPAVHQALSPLGQGGCGVAGVWFDGEEAVLTNWSDGEEQHPAHVMDHTYGSRHAASRLTACGSGHRCLPKDLGGVPIRALVLLDMVGSPNVQVTRDLRSSPALLALAQHLAAALGDPDLMGGPELAVADDHEPFRQQGVAAINLIDFQHLETWHQPSDEPSRLSLASISRVGRLASALAVALATQP